jgi:hypothetical protein
MNDAQQGRVQCVHAVDSHGPTFAVVLLHVLNALAAASMASFVSDRPISGIVPSSSSVAGSDSESERVVLQHEVMMRETRTRNNNLVAGLCIQPFPIDKRLKFNQTWIFETELGRWGWGEQIAQLRSVQTTEA